MNAVKPHRTFYYFVLTLFVLGATNVRATDLNVQNDNQRSNSKGAKAQNADPANEDDISELNAQLAKLKTDDPDEPKAKNAEKSDDEPENESLESPKKISAEQRDAIYGKVVSVNEIFLSFDQKEDDLFAQAVHDQLNEFKAKHAKARGCTLDLTGFSSRARIFILTEVINTKVKKLDSNDSASYWTQKPGAYYLTDNCKTKLKVGDFTYTLVGGPTKNQKGSGSLWGISSAFKGEKYTDLVPQFKKHEAQLENFGQRLLQQKKDGQPITGTPLDKELNGFNLLLDYEVARRRVAGDPYVNTPILQSVQYLLTRFNPGTIDKFLIGLQGESPFLGVQRDAFIKVNLLPEQIASDAVVSSRGARNLLKFAHQDSEDSEHDYSDVSTDDSEGDPEDEAKEA